MKTKIKESTVKIPEQTLKYMAMATYEAVLRYKQQKEAARHEGARN